MKLKNVLIVIKDIERSQQFYTAFIRQSRPLLSREIRGMESDGLQIINALKKDGN